MLVIHLIKKEKKILKEEKIAYLGFIQGAINRMAGTSLAIKGSSITLVAAIITVMGATNKYSNMFLISGLFPIIIFCVIDARYLKLEKQFRLLYDEVREERDVILFNMNPNKYKDMAGNIYDCLFSWSIIIFYSTVLIIFLISVIIFKFNK